MLHRLTQSSWWRRGTVAWWKRLPIAQQVTAGAEAVALAYERVDANATDAEVIAQLRNLRGGRRALQDAAVVVGNKPEDGYPATRIYRLLREAAGDVVQAPTDEQRAVEDRQRQLWEQPLEESFGQLAAQVPELREL